MSEVRHSNRVTQAGFTMIPNVVMLRRDLSPSAKLVYGYLKHLAWRNQADSAEPPLKVIANDLGMSERALQGYLKELRSAPVAEGRRGDVARLVVSERRGLGLANAYIVNDPIVRDGVAESAELDRPNVPDPARARSLLQEEELQEEHPPVSPQALAVPADPNRPASVNRKAVTEDEYARSLVVLGWFNQLAGTNYTSGDWHRKIISRLREHPELPVEAHEHVIRRAFADPWWTGPASPSVVYGNAAVFERAVHAVRVAPSKRGLTPEEMEAYDV